MFGNHRIDPRELFLTIRKHPFMGFNNDMFA